MSRVNILLICIGLVAAFVLAGCIVMGIVVWIMEQARRWIVRKNIF